MEEIKCDKCTDSNQDIQDDQMSIAKMVVAKCLDCNFNMCTNCLIEHHFVNKTHKFVNLIEQTSDEQKTVEEFTTEINNNVITEKCYNTDDMVDSELIKRRQLEDEHKNSTKEQLQLQHMQQLQHYQVNNQVIANKLKQQQQQQAAQTTATNAKLVQIENEINKTFNFYVQMLKERKEYLVRELNTIIQFALLNHNQNVNKQLQVQFQLEMKKQQVEKEITDDYDLLNGQSNGDCTVETNLKQKLNFLNELNNLILVNNQLILQLKSNNPLMSIEFISNYSAIQTSIRNTFGYIRINPQTQQVLSQTNTNNFIQNKSSFNPSNTLTNELSVMCDLKSSNQMASSGSTQHNLFSNNSTSTNASAFSSASSTSSSSSSSSNAPGDLITSPVSIIMKKKADKVYQGEKTHDDVQDDEDDEDTTTLKSNDRAQQQETITLSAGSASSQKSSKSMVSNSSLLSSSSSSSNQSAINLANLSNAKHPLSYLYSNFIQSNPKLNGFNFSSSQNEIEQTQPMLGSSNSFNSLKSINSLTNLNQQFGNAAAAATATSSNQFNQIQPSNSGHLTSQIQLQRSKMIYHCKFGEFGINDGQFTEPSGVTINTNNDIIVADTNSHRIQIFDKDGNFKFKFGECGKRDGQLLYPNRVSIVKQTGDIVVTERSPTHQIQIYNKYGQFLRKFGANILQHPRGVCVDHKGRIVVVECKVMRVIIFDLYGNVLSKFNCSKYLEFPNGVCCSNPTASNNYREEIYISDNRAHCIKVFDYNGNFIRQIGAEGITNYPIGVGINSNNEILVADNHNNFNLTVFTQDGKLINALESKVKHAQCFDVGLMDDGSIVLASKDYRIYVYKYTTSQSQSISPLSTLNLASSGSLLDQHLHNPTSSISPTTSSTNQGLNLNYDLFTGSSSNDQVFNIFNSGESKTSGLSSQLLDPFADLANEQLFSLPSMDAPSNLASSLYANTMQDQTDNLNTSFSSLLNLSTNTNQSSNVNQCNLASILNGIL